MCCIGCTFATVYEEEEEKKIIICLGKVCIDDGYLLQEGNYLVMKGDLEVLLVGMATGEAGLVLWWLALASGLVPQWALCGQWPTAYPRELTPVRPPVASPVAFVEL